MLEARGNKLRKEKILCLSRMRFKFHMKKNDTNFFVLCNEKRRLFGMISFANRPVIISYGRSGSVKQKFNPFANKRIICILKQYKPLRINTKPIVKRFANCEKQIKRQNIRGETNIFIAFH